MAHDLIFKNSKRNWARSSAAPGIGDEARPPTTTNQKIFMGAMAAATGLGLLFIGSGWWRSTGSPSIQSPARSPSRSLSPHAYHFSRSPSGRVIARPI